jgi:hypothetical protein
MHQHKFLLGNQVKYTGDGIKALGKKSTAWGEVVGYVRNEPDHLVIDFGQATYIIAEDDLAPYVFTEKEKGPEVEVISKKWDDL